MENKRFAKILRRYHAGEATDAEKALVEQWYDLLDEENPSGEPAVDEQAMEDRVWARLEQQMQPEQHGPEKPASVVWLKYWKQVAALAAAIVVGLVLWLGGYFQAPEEDAAMAVAAVPMEEFMTIHNDVNGTKVVELADKSVIRLAPGATLKVPRTFHPSRREVFLSGEAFFEIAKNPDQPFFVYSGKVTTRVLGTSFNIKPLANGDQIEVIVRTGKVEVFETFPKEKKREEIPTNGVVLTPNQKVVYHQTSGFFEATVVQTPLPLEQEDVAADLPSEFLFSETPLREVVRILEQAYGIEILLEANLNDCPFSGDISKKNLFHKLDIINLALGTTYEVKGTRILIKGQGCE